MNEFVARNGLIALDSSSIFGPLSISGSIGIDTSSPTAKLDVRGNISSSGNFTIGGNIYKSVDNNNLGLYGGPTNSVLNGFIKINGQSNLWGQVQINIGYEPDNSKGIWTLNDSTQLMTLTGRGRLGIGVTSPTSILHVNGTSTLSGSLLIGSSNGTNTGTWIDSNGTINVLRSINGATYGLRVYNGAGWAGHNAIEAIAYQYPIYGAQGSNGSAIASPLSVGAGVFGRGGVGVQGLGATPAGDSGSIGVMASTLFVHNASNTALYDRSASVHIVGTSQTVLKIDSGTVSNILFITSSGNVGIGTTSPTARLDVSGSSRFEGSAIITGSVDIVGNLRLVGGGISSTALSSTIEAGNTFTFLSSNGNVNASAALSFNAGNGVFITRNTNITITSGEYSWLYFNPPIARAFAPTTGSGTMNGILLNLSVSQTGGANGITRGVYINPTLSSAWDFRAIEWSNNASATSGSWGLYGAGTAPNYLAGNLGIGTTTPAYALTVANSVRFGTINVHTDGCIGCANYFRISHDNSSGTIETIGSTGGRHIILRTSGNAGNIGINTTNPTFRLDVNGSFRASGSITATSGSDYFDISHDITQPAQTGSQVFDVNVTPTFRYTAPNQTQTAFRVAATFSGSTALSSSQSNIIADFGSTSAGSQLVVNDTTSGSIYMVNDVSGLPIIEANSNWDVLIYDYPSVVLRKTGSVIEVSGSLRLNGSSLDTAWTTYTPQWTAAVTNPVLNNGTITGAYKLIGKTCFVRVRLVVGSTTTLGSGQWYFSLPFSASIASGIQFPCSILDNGNAWYQGTVNGEYGGFTDRTAIIGQTSGSNSSQGIDGTFPIAWGTSDSLQFNGSYEIA